MLFSKSLTLPRLISLENICAIEGIENEDPLDSLKASSSEGCNLIDNLGSKEEKLFESSYLPAILKSKTSLNSFSPSMNKANLFLSVETFFPPPKKNKSAVLIIFPSISNSAVEISLYLISKFSLFSCKPKAKSKSLKLDLPIASKVVKAPTFSETSAPVT